MSQTRARRIYRRWIKYAKHCRDIGGTGGNRVPEATARAALALFLKVKVPYPTWPARILQDRWSAE